MKPCFNVRFFRKSNENYNIHFVTSEVMLAIICLLIDRDTHALDFANLIYFFIKKSHNQI